MNTGDIILSVGDKVQVKSRIADTGVSPGFVDSMYDKLGKFVTISNVEEIPSGPRYRIFEDGWIWANHYFELDEFIKEPEEYEYW